ncbi:MAG: hypothetical protein CFE24_00370 [Flavobacterium sp. BFFFF2]|nr:MAG: hypothetical protein CFE24_00370 [Flavobacterium sp. BFFFF2]
MNQTFSFRNSSISNISQFPNSQISKFFQIFKFSIFQSKYTPPKFRLDQTFRKLFILAAKGIAGSGSRHFHGLEQLICCQFEC